MTDMRLLPDRAAIAVKGPDAAEFLQGLITQSAAATDGGRLAFGALLTPQGKIIFDFLFSHAGDGFVFDCAAASADAFVKRLTLYRLRAQVEIARRDDLGVFRAAEGSEGLIDPRRTELGRRLIAPRAEVNAEDDAGAYDARRIAQGVPEFGKDYAGEEMFLTDVNADALAGVDYKKGCFVGQEVSSRMKRKGEIRRRTLIARFDGAPPEKGAEVKAGESTLGEILSGVDGAALALIRLDRLVAARLAGSEIMAAGRALRLEVPAYLEAD